MIRVLYLNGSFQDRQFVVQALTAHGGFQVTRTTERLDLGTRLAHGQCDLILSDTEVLGFPPLEVIDFVRARSAAPPVMILTASESVDLAVEAMKRGAADYVLLTSENVLRLPQRILAAVDRTRLEKKLREGEQQEAAQESLRRSEQRFRAVSELVSDYAYAFHVEPDGKLTAEWVTDALVTVTGYTAHELKSLGGWERLIHPDDLCIAEGQLERLLSGEANTVEYRIVTKSGEVRWTRDYARPEWDEEEQRVVRIYGAGQDITDRKRVEEALERSERLYRGVIEATGGVPYCRNYETNGYDFIGEGVQLLTGYAVREFTPDVWDSIIQEAVLTGDLAGLSISEAERRVRSGASTVARTEVRIVTRSGDERWLSDASTHVRDEHGVSHSALGILHNITERKQAEEVLRTSERRFRTLVEQSPFGILLYNTDGTVRYANEALRTMHKLSKEEFEYLVAHYNILQDEQLEVSGVAPRVRKAFEGEPSPLPTIKYDTRKSSMTSQVADREAWIEGFVYPIKGQDGDVQEVVVVHRDVSEQKEQEAALKESEERFRALFDNALDGILMADTATKRLLSPNPAMCRMLGYRREEIEQLKVFDIHPQADVAHVVEMFEKQAREGLGLAESIPMKRKDGSVSYADINSSPITLAGQRYLIGFFRDTTERKRSEEKLRAMESQLAHVTRLSTMGELVAGIAHEVNQPLYSIENFAKAMENVLAANCGPELEQLRDWTAEIAAAAARAGRIMKRLRGFARPTDSQRSTVDINEIVSESIKLMAFESRQRRVMVQWQLCVEDARVEVDRVQVQQVLVNLLRNAFEALDQNDPGNRKVVVETRVREGSICVTVADNGPGLPPEGGLKLFDAFATTKPDGLGVGLAISTTIVEAHGGRLWATSDPHSGAKFSFTLPIARGVENDGA
jgi:PAS domain S-box-containing protein